MKSVKSNQNESEQHIPSYIPDEISHDEVQDDMSIENIEEEVIDIDAKGIEMNGLVEDTLVFNI